MILFFLYSFFLPTSSVLFYNIVCMWMDTYRSSSSRNGDGGGSRCWAMYGHSHLTHVIRLMVACSSCVLFIQLNFGGSHFAVCECHQSFLHSQCEWDHVQQLRTGGGDGDGRDVLIQERIRERFFGAEYSKQLFYILQKIYIFVFNTRMRRPWWKLLPALIGAHPTACQTLLYFRVISKDVWSRGKGTFIRLC